MSDRRPQLVPAPGKRVVLVVSREIPTDPELPEDRRLMAVLGEIEQGGWTLVGIVEPERYLDALAMVVDGLADVVAITRAEDFPVIRLASQLNATSPARTQLVARPGMSRTRAVRRRPQIVGADEEPGERRPA